MGIIGFIVLGDRTSHGGQVIECTSHRSIDGVKVARVGDLVWCPRCKRNTRIVSSRFPQVTDSGVPSAFDQDTTDCGALLYSRHNGHAGFGSAEAPAGPAPAPVRAAGRFAEPGGDQEHFALRDLVTGAPATGVKYTVHSADGRATEGETDAQGLTSVVWTDEPDGARLTVQGKDDAGDDPYHFPEPDAEEI